MKEEANPEIHMEILRHQSAVFWDSMPRRREIEHQLNGYIYLDKAVRYRCKIERMINRENLLNRDEEHQYVPSFRRQCLFGQWENGDPHRPSETWIKILQIKRLKPPLQVTSLLRYNGQPLRAVVGGVAYIQDPLP